MAAMAELAEAAGEAPEVERAGGTPGRSRPGAKPHSLMAVELAGVRSSEALASMGMRHNVQLSWVWLMDPQWSMRPPVSALSGLSDQ